MRGLNSHIWTNAEEKRLTELAQAGQSATQIALAMGLTNIQVTSRMSKLRKRGVDIPYCDNQNWWTAEEIEALIRMWNEGVPSKQIAENLGRRWRSISSKAAKLRGRGIAYEPKPRLSTPKRVLPAKVIIQHVCQHFNIPKDELTGPCRKKKLAKPRHIAMSLAYRYSGNSYASVGKIFSGRNHSTVFTSVKIAPEQFPQEMAEIEAQIFAMKEAAE